MNSLIIAPNEDEAAYAQIEAAVMETARGRWFLAEFARRNRHADTTAILGAIDRLSDSMAHQRPATLTLTTQPDEALHNDILEMARAIAAMQREIQAIGENGDRTTAHVSASDELDNVVHTTEQATTTILSAAERVQELAWTLRENAGNADDCDILDRCATDIYTACGFQDLTAQRIAKVVDVLQFIDVRLKGMLDEHDLAEDFAADELMIAENEERPAAKTDDVWMSEAHQAEIDETFSFFEPAAQVAEPTMVDADLIDMNDAAPVAAARPAQDEALAKVQTSAQAEVAAPEDEDLMAAAMTQEPDLMEPDLDDADLMMAETAGTPEDDDIIAPPAAAPASKAQATDLYAGLTTAEKLRAFR